VLLLEGGNGRHAAWRSACLQLLSLQFPHAHLASACLHVRSAVGVHACVCLIIAACHGAHEGHGARGARGTPRNGALPHMRYNQRTCHARGKADAWWQSEELAHLLGGIYTQIIGDPESIFGRVPAALRTFGGGEVTVSPEGFIRCINSYGCAVSLRPAMQVANQVCSAFAEAEALYLRLGHSPEQLQPLWDMKRTFEMHREVLRRFWEFHSLTSEVRWAMLPAEAREPFGSMVWSAWDYDESDFDFDSDYD
jgi:hypothetical protein